MNKKKAVIIGNGEPPPADILKEIINTGEYHLICADGGYSHLRELDLLPDMIIGDLDSVNPVHLKELEGKVTLLQITEQDDTDVEKALKYCLKQKIHQVLLFSVSGRRLDHEFSNIILLFRYAKMMQIQMITEDSVLEAVTGEVIRRPGKGARVSFFAVNNPLIIKCKGLQYSVPDHKMTFGENESTGNIANADDVEFSISGGYMLLILPVNIPELL